MRSSRDSLTRSIGSLTTEDILERRVFVARTRTMWAGKTCHIRTHAASSHPTPTHPCELCCLLDIRMPPLYTGCALATFGVACVSGALPTASVIDMACSQAGCSATDVYKAYNAVSGSLTLFGLHKETPPLPGPPLLDTRGLEAQTGLHPTAFAPRKRPAPVGLPMAPLESAAGLAVGALLTANIAIQDAGSMASSLSNLRQLEAYQLAPLILSMLLVVTWILTAIDKVLLNERIIEALALLVPERRDTVLRHEAGHFLCACACPDLPTAWRSSAQFAPPLTGLRPARVQI
jgi:hypothetical protein